MRLTARHPSSPAVQCLRHLPTLGPTAVLGAQNLSLLGLRKLFLLLQDTLLDFVYQHPFFAFVPVFKMFSRTRLRIGLHQKS